MLGKLAEWVVGAIVAGVTYLVADKVVAHYSGKHIHEHALALWNRLRDKLLVWAHKHQHLSIVKLVAFVDNIVQSYASATKRRLKFSAIDDSQNKYSISTEEVSTKELQELGIALSGTTDLTPMFYEV